MSSPQLAVVEPPPEETKALAVAKPVELLPPETAYQQMRAMAKDLYDSRLMPQGIQNWQATFAVIQKGRELGIPPMAAVEGISIIKGKPACGAHLMLALVKRDYGPGAIRVAKTDAEECVVEWREVGWPGTSSYRYTMDDARTAGLAGSDTWKKYPAAMLRARCISAVVKMAFPEVVGGMMLPDELGAEVTVSEAGDVVIVDQPKRDAARSSDDGAPSGGAARLAQEQKLYDALGPGSQPIDAEIREPTPTVRRADWEAFGAWCKERGLADQQAVRDLIGAENVVGKTPAELKVLIEATGRFVKNADGDLVDTATGEIVEGEPGRPSLNRLHGLGAERGLDHDALHDLAVNLFGVEHMPELKRGEVDDLETLVKRFDPKEWASLRQLLVTENDTGYQILLGYAEQIDDAKTVKDCQAKLGEAADAGIVNMALSSIATRRMRQIQQATRDGAP